MKICKFEAKELDSRFISLYYRILLEEGTQNAYNRFKNYLREWVGFADVTGYGGRSFIRGNGYHVNVVKTSKYLHIIATMNKTIRPEFVEAMKYFDVIKKFNRRGDT